MSHVRIFEVPTQTYFDRLNWGIVVEPGKVNLITSQSIDLIMFGAIDRWL